jgi:hypothetical protein
MSREQLDPKMLELVQPLAEIASLGAVVDKRNLFAVAGADPGIKVSRMGDRYAGLLLAGSSLIRSLATPGARFTFDAVLFKGVGTWSRD